MKITGHFKDIKNNTIEVVIYKTGTTLDDINIDNSNSIKFAADPIKINYKADDLFQPIISKSCVISVYTKKYLGDYLYANNEHDIRVNINKIVNNRRTCLFAGYVEPNIYSQNYNSNFDLLEIQCTDALAALQYSNVLKLIESAQGKTYSHSFLDYIKFILPTDLDITPHSAEENDVFKTDCYYDRSFSDGIGHGDSIILKNMSVPLNIFLGDKPEDTATKHDVLSEILKYCNLHIIQFGTKYMIFDWFGSDVRDDLLPSYSNLFYDEAEPDSEFDGKYNLNKLPITTEMFCSADTNISLDDIYNQIQLKCELSNGDSLFESPFEKKNITSIFTSKQEYMSESYYMTPDKSNVDPQGCTYIYNLFNGSYYKQEKDFIGNYNYITDENNKSIITDAANFKDSNPFKQIRLHQPLTPVDTYNYIKKHTRGIDTNKYFYYVWYMRMLQMNNNKWHFYTKNIETGEQYDIYGSLMKNNTGQANLLNYAGQNMLVPLMVSFGRSENYYKLVLDGQQPGEPDMKNYIMISINGDTKYFPGYTALEHHKDKFGIVYDSGSSINLSPVDENTTNYIVFNGKLKYQPVCHNSNKNIWIHPANCYDQVADNWWQPDEHHKLPGQEPPKKPFPGQNNSSIYNTFNWMLYGVNGKENSNIFYNNVFFDKVKPLDKITSDIMKYDDRYKKDGISGNQMIIEKTSDFAYPPTDIFPKQFLYEKTPDNLDKVPVLACSLQIGDKYLSENFENEKFTWTTDESSWFTLGFNPKTGDYLLGQDYDIHNNITNDMRLKDTKGTAIPIKKNDLLSGKLKFKILGPVNFEWSEDGKIKLDTNWWGSGNQVGQLILPFVQNIFIEDFECKIYTDNGGIDSLDDKDLVYVTAENPIAINKKDDISFKINTALTPEQAFDHGFNTKINLSNVYNLYDKSYINNMYRLTLGDDMNSVGFAFTKGLPEVLYLDEYYKLYSKPMLIVETDIHVNDDKILHPATQLFFESTPGLNNKWFVPIGMDFSAYYNDAHLILREIIHGEQ